MAAGRLQTRLLQGIQTEEGGTAPKRSMLAAAADTGPQTHDQATAGTAPMRRPAALSKLAISARGRQELHSACASM